MPEALSQGRNLIQSATSIAANIARVAICPLDAASGAARYLRQAGRDGRLLLIDPKTGQTSRRTPKQAFAEEHYYTVVADAPPHCEEVSART